MSLRIITNLLLAALAIAVLGFTTYGEIILHQRLAVERAHQAENAAKLAAIQATQARIDAKQAEIARWLGGRPESFWTVGPSPPGPLSGVESGINAVKPCQQGGTLMPGESCEFEVFGKLKPPSPQFEGDRAIFAPKLDADRAAK